jgi:hypothetical protein
MAERFLWSLYSYLDTLASLTGQYLGSLFMIAGAFVGGFAHNLGTLMGSRVLLGIGTAFARELRRCFLT